MIRAILRLPFLLWVFIAGGLAFRDYKTWEENVKTVLEQSIQDKKNVLSSLQVQTKKAEEFKKSRAEKLAALQELGERFKQTADKLPRQPNIPDLLKSLADLSDKAGLEFSRFRPQLPKRDQYPFLVATALDVTLKGTYIQIMSFLDSAANLTRIVSAEKLTMDNPVLKGIATNVNVNASLVTYHVDDTGLEEAINAKVKADDASKKKAGDK